MKLTSQKWLRASIDRVPTRILAMLVGLDEYLH
jgi:hypothetical protein